MVNAFVHNGRMNAIRHIRTEVFNLKQAEFAAVAGVKQSTVSRWENGGEPSLEEMRAIRRAAIARGIQWNDEWFFRAPASETAA